MNSLGGQEKNRLVLFGLISLVIIGYVLREVITLNFEFVLGLIFLFGVFLMLNKGSRVSMTPPLWKWAMVLGVYWLVTMMSGLYHAPLAERGWSVLNVTHATIPIFMIGLLIYSLKPKIDYFWYLIGLATFATVGLMLAEMAQVGLEGVLQAKRLGSAYSHPSKMGVFANTFFIILLGSLPWAYKKGKRFFIFWLGLMLVNLLGVVLTQTRSAWIGWPEAIIGWGIYYFYLFRQSIVFSFKKLIVVSGLAVVIIWGLLASPTVEKIIDKRIVSVQSNIQQYFSRDEFRTSIGVRFLGYEAAVAGILKSPWLGIGEDAFPKFQKSMTKALALEEFGKKYKGMSHTHIHNQFLMSWLTKGVFAFISVVLIFVFLIWHFTRGLKHATFENKPIWIAGLVFSIASLLSFLPETPLQKSDTSTHFFLLATLLIAFSVLTEERQNHGSEKKEGEKND